ncbi:hypothetical protein [Nisaea sp.]
MTDPVPDIVERLDIGSFRSSLGPALPDGQGRSRSAISSVRRGRTRMPS